MEELLNMSLTELSNVYVEVASKKKEKSSDAPASVTTYTKQDIETLGYYNIFDLAQITPGYYAKKGSDLVPSLVTRGSQASLNEKHLVLIDGIPVNNVRNNAPAILNDFPLFFAEQVEFLRGPASALYGTGAFNGVINVVPQDAFYKTSGSDFKLTIGSENFEGNSRGVSIIERRIMANAWVTGENNKLTVLNVGYYDVPSNDKKSDAGIASYDNTKQLFFRATHKINDFKIGAIYTNSLDGYGTSWSGIPSVNNFHSLWEFVPYIKYEKQINSKLNLTSYVKANFSSEHGGQTNTAGWFGTAGQYTHHNFYISTTNYEASIEANYNPTETLNIIFGSDFNQTGVDKTSWVQETVWSTDYRDPYHKKYFGLSFYAQATRTFDVLSGLNFIAGLRNDNGFMNDESRGKPTYAVLNPRFGLVQKMTDKFSAKVMYGEAFSAPMQNHYLHNEEKLAQMVAAGVAASRDLTLEPEKIRTLEFSLSYTDKKISSNLTAFANQTAHELTRAYWVPGPNTDWWENAPGVSRSYGLEAEVTILPITNLVTTLNYSYAHSKNQSDLWINAVPNHMSNFIVKYKLSTYEFGFVIKEIFSLQNNETIAANQNKYRGYALADLKVGRYFGDKNKVDLQIINIGNVNYYYDGGASPERGRRFLISYTSNI